MRVLMVYKTGKDFGPEYVQVLARAIGKYLPGARAQCLTDDPRSVEAYIEPLTLRHGWSGWWSKIELFREDLGPGPFLYLDLDTIILRELSMLAQIVESGPKPCMLRGRHPKAQQYDLPASGMMSWEAGQMEHIYKTFADDPGRHIKQGFQRAAHGGQRGDQGFIAQWISAARFQDVLPVGYIRHKRDYTELGLSGAEHLLMWSGKPRLHASDVGTRKIWRGQGC